MRFGLLNVYNLKSPCNQIILYQLNVINSYVQFTFSKLNTQSQNTSKKTKERNGSLTNYSFA